MRAGARVRVRQALTRAGCSWFLPGCQALESLSTTAFAVKSYLCLDSLVYLPYLNSNW